MDQVKRGRNQSIQKSKPRNQNQNQTHKQQPNHLLAMMIHVGQTRNQALGHLYFPQTTNIIIRFNQNTSPCSSSFPRSPIISDTMDTCLFPFPPSISFLVKIK
ncbi:hypothetical protein Droror1_Dr00026756 [Drosera rotundifolia]